MDHRGEEVGKDRAFTTPCCVCSSYAWPDWPVGVPYAGNEIQRSSLPPGARRGYLIFLIASTYRSTSQPSPNAAVRAVLALPARQGGLGIVNPIELFDRQQQASSTICGPIVKLIMQQGGDIIAARHEQHAIKKEFSKRWRDACNAEAEARLTEAPPDVKRGAMAAQEPGTSAWLSTVPVKRHGFALHKGAFRDAICLRYGWRSPLLPQTCKCGGVFDISHALICRYGGFPTHRHNQLCDLTASLMGEVRNNVCTEPILQSLDGEHLPRSANTDNNARLDVRARGFWDNSHQDAFLM